MSFLCCFDQKFLLREVCKNITLISRKLHSYGLSGLPCRSTFQMPTSIETPFFWPLRLLRPAPLSTFLKRVNGGRIKHFNLEGIHLSAYWQGKLFVVQKDTIVFE